MKAERLGALCSCVRSHTGGVGVVAGVRVGAAADVHNRIANYCSVKVTKTKYVIRKLAVIIINKENSVSVMPLPS